MFTAGNQQLCLKLLQKICSQPPAKMHYKGYFKGAPVFYTDQSLKERLDGPGLKPSLSHEVHWVTKGPLFFFNTEKNRTVVKIKQK